VLCPHPITPHQVLCPPIAPHPLISNCCVPFSYLLTKCCVPLTSPLRSRPLPQSAVSPQGAYSTSRCPGALQAAGLTRSREGKRKGRGVKVFQSAVSPPHPIISDRRVPFSYLLTKCCVPPHTPNITECCVPSKKVLCPLKVPPQGAYSTSRCPGALQAAGLTRSREAAKGNANGGVWRCFKVLCPPLTPLTKCSLAK